MGSPVFFALFHELFVFIYSQLQNHPKFCRSSNLLLCSLASLPASVLWSLADHSPRFPGTRKSSCFPLASSANSSTMGKSTHFCSLKPSQRTQLFTRVKPRMTMELPQPQLRSQWKVGMSCYFSAYNQTEETRFCIRPVHLKIQFGAHANRLLPNLGTLKVFRCEINYDKSACCIL